MVAEGSWKKVADQKAVVGNLPSLAEPMDPREAMVAYLAWEVHPAAMVADPEALVVVLASVELQEAMGELQEAWEACLEVTVEHLEVTVEHLKVTVEHQEATQEAMVEGQEPLHQGAILEEVLADLHLMILRHRPRPHLHPLSLLGLQPPHHRPRHHHHPHHYLLRPYPQNLPCQGLQDAIQYLPWVLQAVLQVALSSPCHQDAYKELVARLVVHPKDSSPDRSR